MAIGDKTDPARCIPHPDDFVRGAVGLTLTTAVPVIAAVTGAKIMVRDLSISNNSETATEVILLDGDTEIGRFPAPAGGGSLPVINAVGSVGTALNAKLTIAAETVNIYVTGYAFK